MLLKIVGQKEHNGFLLRNEFECASNIIVLTGRNGCGKTRFLQSIESSSSIVAIDDVQLTNQNITFIAQLQLIPQLGGGYDDSQAQMKITSTLQMFDLYKDELDTPFKPEMSQFRSRNHAMPFEYFHRLCQVIARKKEKLPSELTHDEIRLYYEDEVYSVLGFQNISSICNQYHRRYELNKYNRYLAEVGGEKIDYMSDELFRQRFGNRPWNIINEIVESIFENKFHFNALDEKLKSYSYNATLIQKDTGLAISSDSLSSGEKTLLWLALTLFNSQYYNSDAVKSPKILLLDEPDAFLHPQMVVKMYDVLNSFSRNFDSKILITTHSPTTVALAPKDSIYVVSDNSLTSVSKDEAVAELLYGVTQISISPENRRQVFVESQYDVDIYQNIHSKLVHRSKIIDPKISLNFVSSGPKMPDQHIADKLKQVLDISNREVVDKFVTALNGAGNCIQVIGQVEALHQNNHEQVRGIIDWDLVNKPQKNIAVLGLDYAYSIECIALDPICISLLLHNHKPGVFTMQEICGSDVSCPEWLQSSELMQDSVDRFIKKVLGRENDKKSEIDYFSGKTVKTDSEYLSYEGHSLEKLILKIFPELLNFTRTKKEGELKYQVVNRAMIHFSNGNLIPKAFELILSEVQK